ncbi:MAG TPA: HD domain-containing protein [Deltaproteobacteria bacterium]|nr:HD domain-containing protein [Deltaproteobacteria bacterium]
MKTSRSAVLSPKLIDQLLDISREYSETEGGCHGYDHSERVHTLALHIGRLMNARLDILSAAALLHDIGRQYETKSQGKICHALKGAEMAKAILTELKFPEDIQQEIIHCIESHRYRNNNIPQSLEAKILFDADKLDSIGAIGIGRAFLFAGQVGARLHNQEVDIEKTSSYTREDTAYREFLVKLSKVKDKMLTPEGKRLALERHEFMEIYFKRLEKEING